MRKKKKNSFKVGDRVYWRPASEDKHRRQGTVIEILGDEARVEWDDNGMAGSHFKAVYKQKSLVYAIPLEEYREFQERIEDRLK